jgi:hypothetical protein
MSSRPLSVDDFVKEGLRHLQIEAFAEDGPAYGADEMLSTSVVTTGMSQRTEKVLRGGVWGPTVRSAHFSRERMEEWMQELRSLCYVPGQGTWRSCQIRLFANAPGELETFDKDIVPLDSSGKPADFLPADAATISQDLRYFPRSVDNIPQWMWDVLRSGGITPPVYNPDLKTVDWDNRRLPVTESGTDFSVDPVIIDPSKEPGFFSKIGAKLFGS